MRAYISQIHHSQFPISATIEVGSLQERVFPKKSLFALTFGYFRRRDRLQNRHAFVDRY